MIIKVCKCGHGDIRHLNSGVCISVDCACKEYIEREFVELDPDQSLPACSENPYFEYTTKGDAYIAAQQDMLKMGFKKVKL